jgi:hypothetical protein
VGAVHEGRAHQLWYYEELARAFATHLPGPLSDELTRTVSDLRRLVSDTVPAVDVEVADLRARLAIGG